MDVTVQMCSTDATDNVKPDLIKKEDVKENTCHIQNLKSECTDESSDIIRIRYKDEQPAETATSSHVDDMECTTLIGTTDGFSWFVIPKEEPCQPAVDSSESSESRKTTLEDVAIHSHGATVELATPNMEQSCKCILCARVFTCVSHLATHLRTHTHQKTLQELGIAHNRCQGTDLLTQEKRRKHEKSNAWDHSSRTPHLVNHMQTHTGEKTFKCDTCKRSFSGSSALVRHTRTHTGEKPFECSTCKRSFTQNGALVRHMRTHTGEKPFKCDTCERCFIMSSDLVRHMWSHTDEKPFKCDTCKRSFSQPGHLVTHMRTHTGEKPFKCDTCKRSFSHSGYLVTHMRTHTGEKPFKCDTCKRCFRWSSDLVRHMRTHTGETPFKCDTCKRCFSLSRILVKHMRTHTGKCDPYKRSFTGSIN